MRYIKLNFTYIAAVSMSLFSLTTMFLMMNTLKIMKTTLYSWELTTIYSSPIYVPVIIDPKGILFSTIVTFISANVLLYSKFYMNHEPYINRFTYLVLAFILSMNLLIFLPHFMCMLLGWDGLGLISYLLVIYYQNPKSLGAGMITALTNRFGDACLLVSIGWTLNQNHWLMTNMWNHPFMNILILTTLTAAMTKSAQIPFSSWLPAAMAAPTPVSALVHSSTLVTAGLFILMRFFHTFSKITWFLPILLFIGSMTMFMAGLNAMEENDLKKVIALSTLSQLGLMMATLGMNQLNLAFFHLLTHALFKSLLFLCAGNLIAMNHHSQDLRMVGISMNQLPFTASALLLSSMSLMGMPFMTGFYSKDIILELSLNNSFINIILLIFFLSTMLTAMYSMRLFYFLFLTPKFHQPLINLNEENTMTKTPTTLLTLSSISLGSIMTWMLFPMNMSFSLNMMKKLFTPCLVIMSIMFILYILLSNSTSKTSLSSSFFLHTQTTMWFLTPMSSQMILNSSLPMTHLFMKTIDQSWTENLISTSAYKMIMPSSKSFQYLQKNPINILISLGLLTTPLLLYFM